MSRILLFLFLIIVSSVSTAQITTSSISGKVSDNDGSLPGAHVIAIHELSGTRYGSICNKEGYYQLKGLRSGGPYYLEISYIGYRSNIIKDIYLHIGETYICNTCLNESTELDEIVILGQYTSQSSDKTGASTHITSKDINRLPNISRSLNDLTKLSPYSMGNGFGGRDQRMNNYSIDGANFNYNMGLDGQILPGGGNPISIDALEEIQISIAPYDVQQTNFIGGSVNAVTKSGTNRFKGSAYTYIKNEHLRGNCVNGYGLGEREKEARYIYGFSLGGPIIKDKLFFFINGEYENSPYPIHKWKLSSDGKEDIANMISRVTYDNMSRFSTDLKRMYGYDTGSWTDFQGSSDSYRLLARVDWNINSRHKLMLRYNYIYSKKDNNVVGSALGISGGPTSIYSMTFRNSTWKQINRINSLTAEINSRLSDNINNSFLASFTFNDGNKRKCNGDFPTVDIMKPDDGGTDRAFMNAGYDQHAWNNGITEKVWSITDNFFYNLGNHHLTAGISFESINVSNCYMRYGAGYYRYKSYDDFVNQAAPIAFALTYSLTDKKNAISDVYHNQFSVYIQDEVSIGSRLKLLYGIRMDIPIYVNNGYENTSIAEMDFNGIYLNSSFWPKSTPMFSPRIGFNYDISGNNIVKLRGGTGIFTGRFPLIFLSKIQEGSGMIQNTISTQKTDDPLLTALAGSIRTPEQIIQEIAPQFPDRIPTKPGAINNIITIDHNFKMPQVWKSSLAIDYHLPLPFKTDLTLEGTFIKDIYAIAQRDINININASKIIRFTGPDNRYQYAGNTEKRIYENVNYAILMDNTSKGYSANFNATLNMTPMKGCDLMAAYTYTVSKTTTSNKSNQVEGAFQQEPSVMGPNYQTLHNAQYLGSPHRIIAHAGYTFDYAKNFATSVSLFYEGRRGGAFSYMYNGDMNNDGYNYDLIYIPKNKNELIFIDQKTNGKVFTAEEQRDAFWKFVNQDPYLKKHKGEYAEAYGAFISWYHRFDLRLAQNFRIRTGRQINTLQLSVDIMNIGNLLNNSWGLIKDTSPSNSARILQYKGINENGEPTYTMSTIKENGENVLISHSFMEKRKQENCWQLQFGIRYIFN